MLIFLRTLHLFIKIVELRLNKMNNLSILNILNTSILNILAHKIFSKNKKILIRLN
jgi:hypothetical protein